jgi:hypothetical protein
VEVVVVAFMVGRELTVVLVIALIAAGGSQLPKLVRALGQGSKVPTPPSTDGEPEPDSRDAGPRHLGP